MLVFARETLREGIFIYFILIAECRRARQKCGTPVRPFWANEHIPGLVNLLPSQDKALAKQSSILILV
jgi:hypothetical protein